MTFCAPASLAGEFVRDTLTSIPLAAKPIHQRGAWEYSLESAHTFYSIPNPFYEAAGIRKKNPLGYHLATQVLMARYQLTDPCGPWLLRGNFELDAGVVGSAIVHGPESYFFGAVLGARYNFIQPGARLIPYIEGRAGPGVTDSRGYRFAQQQDFTFTYLLGIGVRLDLSPHWSAEMSAIDQHMSNAFLTHPNYGFDSVGVSLGVITSF